MTNYNFYIKGEQGNYQAAFQVDDTEINSSCTCDYHSDRKLCWHRYYVLAGKTQRLQESELHAQKELIARLQKTAGGKDLVRYAKATFGERECCRRCNKSGVVDLNNGILGRFLRIFLPGGRRYFCWSCRWSW